MLEELIDAIEDLYGVKVVGLHPLQSATGKRIYRVDFEDGPSWVLRVYPANDE